MLLVGIYIMVWCINHDQIPPKSWIVKWAGLYHKSMVTLEHFLLAGVLFAASRILVYDWEITWLPCVTMALILAFFFVKSLWKVARECLYLKQDFTHNPGDTSCAALLCIAALSMGFKTILLVMDQIV